MEMTDWIDLLGDDDDGDSCLTREQCLQDFLRDEPAGCLYCRLAELGEEEDD